ncbi:MAG: SDR family oxidoreductase [Clostridia bacterium]|jgi:short-subunit dehydrogenase|nr:SDR family NAD(P)-dependent oxidoreductase [Clostridia bacterium]HPB16790.1 SDR family oxidoreductase [Clostridia bacterium]
MKNVVITGSTRGIGLAMAIEFLKAGCNVTLSGRNKELPQESVTDVSSFKNNYIYVMCDVQKKTDLINLWDTSVEKWETIDIWINNAGVNVPHEFTWLTNESYIQNVIQTNITGMIYGCQTSVQGMLKQGYGAVYSMEGLGSNNMIQIKTILYGTTKHALTYFMRGLAKELKDTSVIVGRLSPGMMLTDFITKDPDGKQSEVVDSKEFKKVFNILADKPETVAKFFVPKILNNTKNGVRISWLTGQKAAWRFITAGLRKNRLI